MEPCKSSNNHTVFFLENSRNGLLYKPLTRPTWCVGKMYVAFFVLNGDWLFLFFSPFFAQKKIEQHIMQQESFLWQIPPFLDCFGDEAAGGCAKLTHKMWSPSALMKYLCLNRLVIFDFLLTGDVWICFASLSFKMWWYFPKIASLIFISGLASCLSSSCVCTQKWCPTAKRHGMVDMIQRQSWDMQMNASSCRSWLGKSWKSIRRWANLTVAPASMSLAHGGLIQWTACDPGTWTALGMMCQVTHLKRKDDSSCQLLNISKAGAGTETRHPAFAHVNACSFMASVSYPWWSRR